MKTLTKSLVKTDTSIVKDTFIVLLVLSAIVLGAFALTYFRLIPEFPWQ